MIPTGLSMEKTIFNFHCPPYASNLDDVPEIDENLNVLNAGHSLVPVGSTAVRRLIEEYQPLLSLHGHIHGRQRHDPHWQDIVYQCGEFV
jgi:Icc-related predicted phosphoesterase